MPFSLDAKMVLLGALAILTLFYIGLLVTATGRKRREAGRSVAPDAPALGTGFFTNFLDTLGIGSYATTTSIFRFFKMVPDERIPGTLNVGHTLPTIIQAFIFTTVIPVDSLTLISMIAAAVLGAWLGAGVVSGWPRRRIQMGMGLCLFGAAILLAMKAGGALPTGPKGVHGVTGVMLAIAVGGNFVLGALMTLGIGLYAPCMILVSLVGMDVTSAFPIMMGSCAFLMPVASARFVRTGSFEIRAALGLALGGIPAVLIAGLIIKNLPLTYVMWLVVVVVIYTSFTLLRSARSREIAADATAAEATA